MSLRTTPLSVSTFWPFEPSPGYGPASWTAGPGFLLRRPLQVVVDLPAILRSCRPVTYIGNARGEVKAVLP